MMPAYYNEHDPKAAAWLRELIARNLIAPDLTDDLRQFSQEIAKAWTEYLAAAARARAAKERKP